jgi:glucose-6-phosphate isomerase
LGARFGLPVLDHDPKVGGRYSVLSVVGMLPTMIAGLDAAAVRAGAQAVLRQALDPSASARDLPPALGAAVAVGLARSRGVGATVMLAYSDRLGSLARWYRQLWAESLGKKGQGTTPIYGTGPVDQHSQLQLWLDGPSDKMFTVLGGPQEAGGAALDADLIDDPSLGYMAGRTLGDLMDASRRATAETLAARGRPVRRIDMARIDESSMGALMMHFMLETVLAADLLQVDPFDQPAVEDGKVLIRRYLHEMGEG